MTTDRKPLAIAHPTLPATFFAGPSNGAPSWGPLAIAYLFDDRAAAEAVAASLGMGEVVAVQRPTFRL